MEHKTPYEQEDSNFNRRVEELRAALENCEPAALAEKTGTRYQPAGEQTGVFYLKLWDRPISISFPDLVVLNERQKPAPLAIQALVMYYFHTAHGAIPKGPWISFSELPDGKFYNQAFQGYSGKQLAQVFGDDTSAVQRAALNAGGRPLSAEQITIGDFAVQFQALPHLPILLVGWSGDEDFPASYRLLFDASAANFLPTDVCAIVGGMLARKIIQQKQPD